MFTSGIRTISLEYFIFGGEINSKNVPYASKIMAEEGENNNSYQSTSMTTRRKRATTRMEETDDEKQNRPTSFNWIGYYRFSLVSIDRGSYRYEFINNAETEEKVPLMDLRMNLRTDNAPRNWRIMRGLSESSIRASSAERSFVSIPSKKNREILRRAPLSREWRSCEGRSYLYSWKIVYWRRRLFQKPNMNIFEWKFTLQE